jgi:hypothetical protein
MSEKCHEGTHAPQQNAASFAPPLSPNVEINSGPERDPQSEQAKAAGDQQHHPHNALSISTEWAGWQFTKC